jgi:hypothetical protein
MSISRRFRWRTFGRRGFLGSNQRTFRSNHNPKDWKQDRLMKRFFNITFFRNFNITRIFAQADYMAYGHTRF